MMRLWKIIILLYIYVNAFCPYFSYGQLKQIATGSNATLKDLSVIKKSIIISGYFGYLSNSNNECNIITSLIIPGPTGNATRLQRLDSNTIFLLNYSPSQTLLFKSTDVGTTWTQKSTLTGSFDREFGFFDTLFGFISDDLYLSKTDNAGNTWTNVPLPISMDISVIKTFRDSIICFGGITVPNASGAFYMSQNRGATWPSSSGFWKEPSDFFFLNKDTVFAISSGAEFTKTKNGGVSWDNFTDLPLASSNCVYFKNYKEGYVIGANSQNLGTILKTTDFGQTWSTFNTGVNTTLLNMAILNDSIALLTGTNGVLLRWNYKSTIFTGIGENKLTESEITIFPNPTTKSLHFKSKFISTANFIMSNTLGQNVFSKNDFDLQQELDLSFLSSGIYFLELRTEKEQKIIKILKE